MTCKETRLLLLSCKLSPSTEEGRGPEASREEVGIIPGPRRRSGGGYLCPRLTETPPGAHLPPFARVAIRSAFWVLSLSIGLMSHP